MALKQETVTQETGQDYFDSMAGEGLDGFTPDTVATAYLSMVQPGAAAAAEHAPGTWRNTANDENYGPESEVVVLAFQTVWTERSSEPPFNTVGQYAPHGIQVNIDRPKPGARGFPKMVNPQTGNKVEELFVYALLLKDRPELGVLYFSPTAGSMRTCKQWNNQLRSQRLPSGKLAPIHAFSWKLKLDLVQNPAKPNNPSEKICKFVKVTRGELLVKDWHLSNVAPQLTYANEARLIAAPEMSGDTDTSAETAV